MENETVSKNFIENIIDKDLAEGVYDTVHTRFPPEPNGYLHIGHAKSILLNYGLAQEYNGKFNMRFDDTNPTKEKSEFVESIKADIKWLGADWEDRLFFASDYFGQMYEAAVKLIQKGKAYVCDLTADQIREYRGTLTEPGKESPYRNRSVEENLQLFEEMKEGKYADGEKVLRAKIDMASPNMNMRDPVIYRVAHMTHHRTGDTWCIYPMYDFAHPIEDAIEGITHSICTLEFEDHRPLYEWVINEVGAQIIPDKDEMPPRQIEFAKLYLTNVVTGKRYIKKLVEEQKLVHRDVAACSKALDGARDDLARDLLRVLDIRVMVVVGVMLRARQAGVLRRRDDGRLETARHIHDGWVDVLHIGAPEIERARAEHELCADGIRDSPEDNGQQSLF